MLLRLGVFQLCHLRRDHYGLSVSKREFMCWRGRNFDSTELVLRCWGSSCVPKRGAGTKGSPYPCSTAPGGLSFLWKCPEGEGRSRSHRKGGAGPRPGRDSFLYKAGGILPFVRGTQLSSLSSLVLLFRLGGCNWCGRANDIRGKVGSRWRRG